MTARHLLMRRVMVYANRRWRAWRLVLDWTVILYVVLPLLFCLGYYYIRLWQDGLEWVDRVPMFIWPLLVLLVNFRDTFFVWIERADVTLGTGRKRIKTLKRYSLSLHTVKLAMKCGTVVLLLMPVLVFRGWPIASILSLFLSVLLNVWLHAWIQYQLKIRRSHWTLRASVTGIAFVCLYALIGGLPLAAVVFGSAYVAMALNLGEGWLSRQPYLSREIDLAETASDGFERALLAMYTFRFFKQIRKGHTHD